MRLGSGLRDSGLQSFCCKFLDRFLVLVLIKFASVLVCPLWPDVVIESSIGRIFFGFPRFIAHE